MLDFVLTPLRSSLRSFLGVAGREAAKTSPVQKTEEELPDIAHAIKGATESIEHQAELIDQLAASVDPLKDSVNNLTATMKDSVDNLTATMNDLVKILGPIAAAERGAHDVEHFFGRHHHQPDAADSHRD